MQTQQTTTNVMITLATWSEAFGEWLRSSGGRYGTGRSAKTVEAYLQDVRHFSNYFERVNGQAFSPEMLTSTDVRGYFAEQDADKTVAPASRNRRLASLRALVRWAAEVGILEYDPTIGVRRVEVDRLPRDKSRREIEALDRVVESQAHLRRGTEKHALLGLRDAVIWALFRDAGLRIQEIADLDVADVDMEAATLRVMGKGGKKASVQVPAALIETVRRWLDARPVESEALITKWRGERISAGQIRRRLYLMAEAAGVDVKPHDLRHTYAYRLLDAQLARGVHAPVALDVVRRQLRHSDSRTTMMYLRARESQIREVVEAL